jgi:hypothetical protein
MIDSPAKNLLVLRTAKRQLRETVNRLLHGIKPLAGFFLWIAFGSPFNPSERLPNILNGVFFKGDLIEH